jgi:CRISPR-associated protein Cas5d
MPTRFCLEISGDFACFTRPEMKVERVSYDIITPSAVRAVFESILWKPAIRWQPEKIEVLAPIRWTTIRRNEVGSKLSAANVKSAMQRGTPAPSRSTWKRSGSSAPAFLLRDVRYRITASLVMTERAGVGDNPQKFAEMFVRRAERGSASTSRISAAASLPATFVLLRPAKKRPRFQRNCAGIGTWAGCSTISTSAMQTSPQPRFFQAHMKDGVVKIPSWDSEEVRG